MRNYPFTEKDYNKLITHADSTIKYEAEKIKIYEALINQLKAYEGKVVNVRIEKAINIDGYNISYKKRYNAHELYVSRTGKGFDIRLTEPSEEKNMRFSLNYLNKSIKQLNEKHVKDKIEVTNVIEYIGKFNTALSWLDKTKEDLKKIPGWYDFSRW